MKQQNNIITKHSNKTNETQEEIVIQAAEQYCLINNIPIDQMIVKHNRSCEFETPVTMFTKGAKWQQEKMYSEEDLLSAFEAGMMFIGEDKGSFKEWL